MDDAAMKHMASNFSKLDKFEGVDFRRWQKKMHFLLSNMSVIFKGISLTGFPAQKRRISDRHRCIRNHHAVLFSRYRNVPSKQTTRISIFTVNTLSITRMFWQDLKDNAYDS
ncbi:hypothetical protein Tco_1378712 [Tanacetum coccineum]